MHELSRPMARIWPNGEFCLWREVKGEPMWDPMQSSPLGLSRVSNSHSSGAKEGEEPTRRGLRGVTRHGQRLIKNGAWLLQKKYGKKRLSFLTCTLPGNASDTFEVSKSWPQIVRVFLQKLKRALVRRGLSPAVVACTEIQPKRFLRDGGMPLHLHLVFQGAHRDSAWEYKPVDYREMWAEVIRSVCPWSVRLQFDAATRVEIVRDSAAGYLGKYMSKGEEDIGRILEANPELIEALPHTWYNLTSEARRAVLSAVVYGPEAGERLESWIEGGFDKQLSPFQFIKQIWITDSEGNKLKSFYCGECNFLGREAFGLPCRDYEILLM